MPLLIDTAVVPARERVAFWSESSCHVFHPLQIRSAVKGQFSGKLSGYELGPLGVFRLEVAANTMVRTVRAIAAHDPECLHVSVILRGQLNAAQGDEPALPASATSSVTRPLVRSSSVPIRISNRSW